MASVLEQVALGFDKAKQTVYMIIGQYYPRISQSRSTLVNAFVSGLAYIYSMFQVFAKLIQDELYIATATELPSLYKLVPFAGVQLTQPITMKITGSAAAQNESDFSDSDIYYLSGTEAFTDSNGYKFYLSNLQQVKQVAYTYSALSLETMYSDTGTALLLSLGKFVGSPFSLLVGDTLVLDVPYIDLSSSLQIAHIVISSGNVLDFSGSSSIADIQTGQCSFNHATGLLILTFNIAVFSATNRTAILGQRVYLTHIRRSMYRKNSEKLNVAIMPPPGASAYGVSSITTRTCRDSGHSSGDTNRLPMYDRSAYAFVRFQQEGIDPTTVKIQASSNGPLFDFSAATVIVNPYWGLVYQASYTVGPDTYYAYVLDATIGSILFEGSSDYSHDGDWSLSYTQKFGSLGVLQQYTYVSKTVNPTADFDFSAMTYVLTDTDPILFSELFIQINDPANQATVRFVQVSNIDQVIGIAGSKAFYEVVPMSPTEIKLRFDKSIAYSAVNSMTILYKVVKDISDYPSGTTVSGSSPLLTESNSSFNGGVFYSFDITNTITSAGTSNIPTVETLRAVLEKGAYTLDQYCAKINYEYAIQYYFVTHGQDAKIKVFDYSDFGTTFLDSVSGNVVYYMGIKNMFPGADPVITLSTHVADTTWWSSNGGTSDGSVVYTQAELAAQLSGIAGLTDILDGIIYAIGQQSDEENAIRLALAPYSCLTNYLLAQKEYVRFYSVYFYVKITPRNQYTFAEASYAVKRALSDMFRWSKLSFVTSINISDVYRELDSLPEVEKVRIVNMGHVPNNANATAFKVQDINYRTLIQPAITAPKTFKTTIIHTNNSINMAYVRDSNVEARYGGAANCIKFGTTSVAPNGFQVGDWVVISGFINPVNNVKGEIATIESDGRVTITGATFSSETVDGARMTYYGTGTSSPMGFVSQGITADRCFNISCLTTNIIESTNTRLVSVSEQAIVLNSEDVVIASSSNENVTMTAGNDRAQNPVWDFSDVGNRNIKIDILALAGITTEQY